MNNLKVFNNDETVAKLKTQSSCLPKWYLSQSRKHFMFLVRSYNRVYLSGIEVVVELFELELNKPTGEISMVDN